MQSERDAEIVSWIGRVGAAGALHVMARFGMGRSWTHARLHALSVDGLLEHRQLLHRTPGLYIASTEGLRWRGLERLGVYRVGPGTFQHAVELAAVAARLEPALPAPRLLSERELRVAESDNRKLLASAKLGELPGGRPALHRPDLALLGPDGHAVAVEIELSVKAPRRLHAICRAYARARHITRTYYLAAPAPARALARAVADTRAEERISILPLAATDALIEAEQRGQW